MLAYALLACSLLACSALRPPSGVLLNCLNPNRTDVTARLTPVFVLDFQTSMSDTNKQTQDDGTTLAAGLLLQRH